MITKRKDARVLVVDDEIQISPFRFVLSDRFRKAGYENVRYVSDTRGLVDKIQDYNPQVILMDTEMGSVRGYDLCRELREGGHRFGIIGMSSSDSYRDAWRQAGADDFLSKMCSDDLDEMIQRVLGKNTKTAE